MATLAAEILQIGGSTAAKYPRYSVQYSNNPAHCLSRIHPPRLSQTPYPFILETPRNRSRMFDEIVSTKYLPNVGRHRSTGRCI